MLKEKVARAIRQLKKGKTEYFDEIYDLTRASVYYVIRGVLKDSYLVEDAMQETYVAFLNSIAKIDDEQNPLSYLLQIAKNKALDEARRMTRAAGAFFFSNCEKSTSFLILSLTSGDFSYNSFIILFLFFIINLAVKRFDFFDNLVIFPVYRGYGFAKHFCDLDAAVSVNRREFQYAEFVVA